MGTEYDDSNGIDLQVGDIVSLGKDICGFKIGDIAVVTKVDSDGDVNVFVKGRHSTCAQAPDVFYVRSNVTFIRRKQMKSLTERIESLQNIGQEAFEIMAEIGGYYDLVIPTKPAQGAFLTVLKEAHHTGHNQYGTVLQSFECNTPCQVGDAYKKALLFMAEREGKLGVKVGDEVKAEIEGKVYKVKILSQA